MSISNKVYTQAALLLNELSDSIIFTDDFTLDKKEKKALSKAFDIKEKLIKRLNKPKVSYEKVYKKIIKLINYLSKVQDYEQVDRVIDGISAIKYFIDNNDYKGLKKFEFDGIELASEMITDDEEIYSDDIETEDEVEDDEEEVESDVEDEEEVDEDDEEDEDDEVDEEENRNNLTNIANIIGELYKAKIFTKEINNKMNNSSETVSEMLSEIQDDILYCFTSLTRYLNYRSDDYSDIFDVIENIIIDLDECYESANEKYKNQLFMIKYKIICILRMLEDPSQDVVYEEFNLKDIKMV